MKKTILTVLLLSFLAHCTPLNVEEAPERRPDEREGEVSIPDDVLEGLSWLEILQNCKPDVNVPTNIIDVGVDIFGLSDQYAPGLIRRCLEKKLSDAHNKICTARVELERKKEKARDENTRARVDNSILKLDNIEFRFNQKLYDLSLKLDNNLEKQRRKKHKHWFVRGINAVRREETEALRDILDIESYSTCAFYDNTKDDDKRR